MSIPPDACCILPDGYRVLEHLRRGAVLDVYDVWSEERACRCVAKVLRADRLADARARRRLLREGRMLLRLSHPHIVRAYGVFKTPVPAIIMETLTGATLSQVIADHPPGLPTRDVAVLGLHLCSAIQYMHRQNILHLDLKPSNIVCQQGVAKVLDLDIARPPGRAPRHGTREYMAPEQIQARPLTSATDVWAIGTVLFEAATAHLPFDFSPGASGDVAFNSAAPDDRTYPQLTRPAANLPRRRGRTDLATILAQTLRPVPEHRPTIPALAAALEPIAGP